MNQDYTSRGAPAPKKRPPSKLSKRATREKAKEERAAAHARSVATRELVRSMSPTIAKFNASRNAGKREVKQREKLEKKSAVYVVASGPFLKVGHTKSSVSKRMTGLQTGSPFPLQLKATFGHNQPEHLESFIHAVLWEYRACGEWFLCSVDDVQSAVDMSKEANPKSVEEWRQLAAGYGAEPLAISEDERRVRGGAATMLGRADLDTMLVEFAEWVIGQSSGCRETVDKQKRKA